MIVIHDFDTGKKLGKKFSIQEFRRARKLAVSIGFCDITVIYHRSNLDIVTPRPFTLFAGVSRKIRKKKSRIRSVAFGCSSSMERRIIIRGIQPSSPSFLSSILSVGLGLPRVTLSSNGISDPSSSSSFDFTTRLRILSTFAFTDTHAAPPPPRPFSFSSLLLPPSSLFLLSRAHSTQHETYIYIYISACADTHSRI